MKAFLSLAATAAFLTGGAARLHPDANTTPCEYAGRRRFQFQRLHDGLWQHVSKHVPEHVNEQHESHGRPYGWDA